MTEEDGVCWRRANRCPTVPTLPRHSHTSCIGLGVHGDVRSVAPCFRLEKNSQKGIRTGKNFAFLGLGFHDGHMYRMLCSNNLAVAYQVKNAAQTVMFPPARE